MLELEGIDACLFQLSHVHLDVCVVLVVFNASLWVFFLVVFHYSYRLDTTRSESESCATKKSRASLGGRRRRERHRTWNEMHINTWKTLVFCSVAGWRNFITTCIWLTTIQRKTVYFISLRMLFEECLFEQVLHVHTSRYHTLIYSKKFTTD